MNTYLKGKKKKERIELLKKELETNKNVLKQNKDLLEMKAKVISEEETRFSLSEKKYNISKALLEIEAKNCYIINPMLGFHQDPKWQDLFQQMKKLEIELNEDVWNNIQTDHENRIKMMNERINETKIQEQFGRICERNPEIIKELKDLGEVIEEEKSPEYIG